MDNPADSPLDTLRQLKEMLDAGALTPAEFEVLKQRLLFAAPPAAPAASAEPGAAGPTVAVVPLVSPAAPVPLPGDAPLAAPAEQGAVAENVPPHDALSGNAPTFPWAEEAKAADGPPPPNLGAAPAASAPGPERDADASWATDEFAEAEAPAARGPLALVLSIGGLLALLALVVYLGMSRLPAERLTSASRTAADSVAAAIEVGPQAAPPTPSLAAPETVRVAPTNPAPAVLPRLSAPVRDSAAGAPAPGPAPVPAAPDSVPNP